MQLKRSVFKLVCPIINWLSNTAEMLVPKIGTVVPPSTRLISSRKNRELGISRGFFRIRNCSSVNKEGWSQKVLRELGDSRNKRDDLSKIRILCNADEQVPSMILAVLSRGFFSPKLRLQKPLTCCNLKCLQQ